jgi:hypothetical protein
MMISVPRMPHAEAERFVDFNMNDELLSLYNADRQDHANQAKANTPEYRSMRARDLRRRKRVMEIMEKDDTFTAEDYFHAAQIMNHGDTPEDAERAHTFATRSSELGHRPARWLAAASYDRWLMYQGKPQKYGTNYIYDGRQDRLWDVDPSTTDAERAAWGVPPLAEQLRKAEGANRHKTPMTERELQEFLANAPDWFKKILNKWAAEAGPVNKDSGQ